MTIWVLKSWWLGQDLWAYAFCRAGKGVYGGAELVQEGIRQWVFGLLVELVSTMLSARKK